jgi:hypothetical protein
VNEKETINLSGGFPAGDSAPSLPDEERFSTGGAGESLKQHEQRLKELEEKRARLLERFRDKVEAVKKEAGNAVRSMAEKDYPAAVRAWKRVLELDPKNRDASKSLEECEKMASESSAGSGPGEEGAALSGASVPVEPEEGVALSGASVPVEPEEGAALSGASVPVEPEEGATLSGTSVPVEPEEEAALSGTSVPVEPEEEAALSGTSVPRTDGGEGQESDESEALSQEELNRILEDVSAEKSDKEAPEPESGEEEEEEEEEEEDIMLGAKPDSSGRDEEDASGGAVPEEKGPESKEPGEEGSESDGNAEPVSQDDSNKDSAEIPAPVSKDQDDSGEDEAISEDLLEEIGDEPDKEDKNEPGATEQVAVHPVEGIKGNPRVWIGVVLAAFVSAALFVGVNVARRFSRKPDTVAVPRTRQAENWSLKVERKLAGAKSRLQSGETEHAYEILRSLSDDYPSTATMQDNLFEAADLYRRFVEGLENPKDIHFTRAARLYEQVIEQFPYGGRTDEAYFKAARCYDRVGAFDKTSDYLEALTRHFPESEYYEKALFRFGEIMLTQYHKFEEARRVFLSIIRTFPESASARMARLYIARSFELEAEKITENYDLE